MSTQRNHAIYAFEKFSSACYELAVGEGNIKQRLLTASDKFLVVSPEMLPPEIQDHFVWVKNELTKFPSTRGEGEILATIRKMHNKTLVKIAKRIVLVESLLRAHLEVAQNSFPSSWSPPVIAFINKNEQ